MVFGIFMLDRGLLILLTMVCFGKLFLTKVPKKQYDFWISNGYVHEKQEHMGVCT